GFGGLLSLRFLGVRKPSTIERLGVVVDGKNPKTNGFTCIKLNTGKPRGDGVSDEIKMWGLPADDYPQAYCGVVSVGDRKSTRLNSSHVSISYAVFCLKK